jgi:hypothetical protein
MLIYMAKQTKLPNCLTNKESRQESNYQHE